MHMQKCMYLRQKGHLGMLRMNAQKSRFTTLFSQRIKRFTQEEDGSGVIFALFVLVIILLFTGMAVDLMRVETTRTQMQNTVDRAVLAAADLDQPLEPREVVIDYFEKAGLDGQLVGEPTVEQGLNYRIVSAEAEAVVPMMFSGLAAVTNPNSEYHENMIVPALSTAQERVSKVEISLVLDVSGSMGSSNRIQNLRTAATEFVDTVLAEDNTDMINVSLVPYSEHVSMGDDLFGALSIDQTHSYNANCIEFESGDFYDTGIDPDHEYEQVQHFQWVAYNSNNMDYPVCATRSWAQINPWNNDRVELRNQIADLEPYSQTSIFLGMKWGVALLDPSMRPVLNELVGDGVVDAEFLNRPADYDDVETLKFIILMTDGVNTSSYRIQDWAYDTSSEQYHWSRYNLIWYINRYVYYRYRSSYYTRVSERNYGDNMLDRICDAAKDAGIVVWTIGFELPDSSAEDVMENCASSPSHFYSVDGIEIASAFGAIATQINNLKLTR